MKLVMSWEHCQESLRDDGFSDVADHVKKMLELEVEMICVECKGPLGAAHVHVRGSEALCSEGCTIKHEGIESMEVPV